MLPGFTAEVSLEHALYTYAGRKRSVSVDDVLSGATLQGEEPPHPGWCTCRPRDGIFCDITGNYCASGLRPRCQAPWCNCSCG